MMMIMKMKLMKMIFVSVVDFKLYFKKYLKKKKI